VKLNVSVFLKGIEEVKREFGEAKREVENLFFFYKWYLEDMEVDPEDYEWGQVFPLRTRLQEIFRFSLPGIAVTAGKEREYRMLVRRLRELDMELQRRRNFLKEVFDFESFRREEAITGKVEKISEKLWWYYLDSDNVPEFTVPFWLKINKDLLKFKAIIVEGLVNNQVVNVLLFTSILINKKQREQLEKDLLLNIHYDYPTFVYNRLQAKDTDVKAYIFVLPISGLFARLDITSIVDTNRLSNRKLVVAFPKEEGVFKTKFYEELREALFRGNTGFLNEKTLKEDEFDFFNVETFVGMEMCIETTMKTNRKETQIQTLLQPERNNLVGDVVLVV